MPLAATLRSSSTYVRTVRSAMSYVCGSERDYPERIMIAANGTHTKQHLLRNAPIVRKLGHDAEFPDFKRASTCIFVRTQPMHQHTCVTSLIFEGVPSYPDNSRCWAIVEKYKVKQFYTAPTAIRALMSHGDDPVTKHDRSSLQILGTVGEPINPEAWRWYEETIGDSRCPIVDTWWQTETGGHMITPLPGAWPEKPGSATLPFFGSVPVLLEAESGVEIEGEGEGVLCIKQAWPSTMRSLYNAVERYEETYFKPYKGYYFTGDAARRDKDGYFWITGRVDDVINVSGHRIGTAEVESALVLHVSCAEAAVVGYEHPIKGMGIYAYVTLMDGVVADDDLRKDLVGAVRQGIGAFAAPDVIHWAPSLPKTRSGKIMRRILRKIASGEIDQLGDTSTLADPAVVDQLIESKGK